MKEINEKTAARAKRSIVSLGIVRGILYAITAVVTYFYSFGALNGMEAITGVGAASTNRWLITMLFKLLGYYDTSAYFSITQNQRMFVENMGNFSANMEVTFGTNWFSLFALPLIAVLLVICFVLYLRARSLRLSLAAAERV